MENRIIEIAQKKARHRSAKSFHATSGVGGHKPLFSGPPGPQAMAIRFPPDIRPEKRAVGTTTLAFVLAAPSVEVEKPPRGKAAPRKKPRSRTKPAKKATGKATAKTKTKTKTPKPKASAAAKSLAVPLAAPPPPVTPVPDLEPPFIPAALKTPAPMPDAPMPDGRAPLPRARAVAVYRKNGLFDVIGYWLRTGWSGVARSFKIGRKPPREVPPVAQLLAENAALRQEVIRLRAQQGSA